MNSVRNRIIMELVRRLEANEFQTVNWDRVIRTDIPDDYDASHGTLLALLEGNEPLAMSAQQRMCTVELYLSFAVPLAAGEDPQTVSNNVAAEIVNALHGDKRLEEGGPGGAVLNTSLKATEIMPNLTNLMDNCAAGTVVFDLRYRTATHDLFTAA